YLRGSLFQRGEESVFGFVLTANIRVFRFLFSQGAVAVVGLMLFVMAIVLLFRRRAGLSPIRRKARRMGALEGCPYTAPIGDRRPPRRQLAILFALPFVVNCAAALADAYPYGASRHNSYLAIFAMPAIATLLAARRVPSSWMKPAVIAVGLAICNFTIAPAGAYIPAKHQRKTYMHAAADWIQTSVPANSVILADYESGLLAGYYLCHRNVVQPAPPYQIFYPSPCADFESVTLMPPLWIFRASTFPEQMPQLRQMLASNHLASREIWLFQAGYIVDKEPEFRTLLAGYGCVKPQEFGPNIFVCRIAIS